MKIFGNKRRVKSQPEDVQLIEAGLGQAASMISDNATTSLLDGRWGDVVADLAQASRQTQISLHEAIEKALTEGETFQTLASESHLSPEYLKEAYERFDRGMWAQPGPDEHGREPWRVLG
ncbi:hypothetical protein [Streptomyces parvus]|uniref:hypothetical protein n=1 Tax=Streptomyces parvus TaxID=66428 RepID=UPI0033CFBFAB